MSLRKETRTCECCGTATQCNVFTDRGQSIGVQEYALCDYCYGSSVSNVVLHPHQVSDWTIARSLGAMFNLLEKKLKETK